MCAERANFKVGREAPGVRAKNPRSAFLAALAAATLAAGGSWSRRRRAGAGGKRRQRLHLPSRRSSPRRRDSFPRRNGGIFPMERCSRWGSTSAPSRRQTDSAGCCGTTRRRGIAGFTAWATRIAATSPTGTGRRSSRLRPPSASLGHRTCRWWWRRCRRGASYAGGVLCPSVAGGRGRSACSYSSPAACRGSQRVSPS